MIVVATAGWSVKEWYDEGVEPRERLRALAAHLDGVEVDSSFYALPSASTVERWAEITPAEAVDAAAHANLMLCFVIGRWHQFAKSGFKRDPLETWPAQWKQLVPG